jgi:hypothetical protein
MTSDTNRRFRFNLKSMLLAMVALAVLLTLGAKIYEWYYAGPTLPLADAVASFNAQYTNDPIGKFEPPLTETEIIASIRSQLPGLQASDQVKSVYAEIVRKKRVPQGASLNSMPGYDLGNGQSYTVWWINLDVPTGKNSGYGLRIRENNSPGAKPEGEPKLNRPSFNWLPTTSK